MTDAQSFGPLVLPGRDFSEASFFHNLRAHEDWAATIGNMFSWPLHFSEQGLAAAQVGHQFRRIVAGGGGPAQVQRSVFVPFSVGLIAMSLVASAAPGAGSADFHLFAAGGDAGYPTLSWSAGATALRLYDPTSSVLSAGQQIDVRADTSAGFAGAPDVEVTIWLVRFS